jgi:hypothetical protein
VRFNAAQLLGGNWEPYPIDMQFGPPCMVLSTIGALRCCNILGLTDAVPLLTCSHAVPRKPGCAPVRLLHNQREALRAQPTAPCFCPLLASFPPRPPTGLTSPGKIERGARAASCKNHLHQLHVCLPSSEGEQ